LKVAREALALHGSQTEALSVPTMAGGPSAKMAQDLKKSEKVRHGTCNTSTSSTAQGGGGSFKNRKPIGVLAVVNQGWQSEATDGPKGA